MGISLFYPNRSLGIDWIQTLKWVINKYDKETSNITK